MATKAYTVTEIESLYGLVHRVQWTLANLDDGAPFAMPGSADRSIQISGTFGAAGSVTIEGSNEGGEAASAPTYATLHDPQGNALTLTAAKILGISEVTNILRPRCTAGDGTTALVLSLVIRRPRQ